MWPLVTGPAPLLPIALKTNNFLDGRRPRRAVGSGPDSAARAGRRVWRSPEVNSEPPRALPALPAGPVTPVSRSAAARAFYERHSIKDKGASPAPLWAHRVCPGRNVKYRLTSSVGLGAGPGPYLALAQCPVIKCHHCARCGPVNRPGGPHRTPRRTRMTLAPLGPARPRSAPLGPVGSARLGSGLV